MKPPDCTVNCLACGRAMPPQESGIHVSWKFSLFFEKQGWLCFQCVKVGLGLETKISVNAHDIEKGTRAVLEHGFAAIRAKRKGRTACEQTCEVCRFCYVRLPEGVRRCHRHAPTGDREWPRVCDVDRCGEWEGRHETRHA